MRQQDVFASSQILAFHPILQENDKVKQQYFVYLKKLIRLVKWDRRKYTKAQIAYYRDVLCNKEALLFAVNSIINSLAEYRDAIQNDAIDTLREILNRYKSPVMEGMPHFTGGLVGYFSYDYIKYSEPKLNLSSDEQQDFRDMDLMLFDQVIAFDHYRQKVLLIAGVMADRVEESYRQAEEALEEMAALIRGGEKKEFAKLELQSEICPQFPKEEYCEMVEKARKYIREGDIFQVVLSNPITEYTNQSANRCIISKCPITV